MRKYIFIGIGCFLGSISRYSIFAVYSGDFPLDTLLINVTGSFLLAFIITTALELWHFDSDVRNGLTVGFLGAFTTFSALCKETVELLYGEYYITAFLYILLSTILGLGAAYLGIVLARRIGVSYLKFKIKAKGDAK